MAVTYDPIATNTLASPATTLTFSSIPSTYTDLVIVCNLGQTGPANVGLRYNGDSGSNYSSTVFYAVGTAAPASGNYTDMTHGYGLNAAGQLPNTITASGIIQIFSYSSTVAKKTSLSKYANTGLAEITSFCSTWRSTAVINSIELFSYSSSYLAGSSFTLYGIKAA